MTLRLHDLRKRFGAVTAVDGITLELGERQSIALVGPSGCGKSTLLRLVAGLDSADSGVVWQHGVDVTGLPPEKREVGMVFQDYALFPHLDVAANVGFALVERGWPRPRVRERVAELLELVGLEGLERRRVFHLSGGQQQRVALARALAARPRMLLLDEPLSNLDPGLRQALQRQLADLLAGIGVSAIYVTHDQDEAFAVAPLVAVMRAGKLLQLSPPDELLSRPRTAWIARFLGYRNIVSGDRLGRKEAHAVLVRDQLVGLDGDIDARVTEIERSGHRWLLRLDVPAWGTELLWEGYRRELPTQVQVGAELGLRVPEEAFVELAAE